MAAQQTDKKANSKGRRSRKERLAGMGREILDIAGAAEFLGVSETTLYRLARKGEIPCVKAGREWRFARQTLVNWVATGSKANQLQALFKNVRPG